MTLTDKLKQVQTRLLDIATGMYSDAPKATECCAKNALDLMPEIIKEVEANQWQDISTGPKDGTIIQIYNGEIGHGYWLEFEENNEFGFTSKWTWCGEGFECLNPTHWQPLKPPHEEK